MKPTIEMNLEEKRDCLLRTAHQVHSASLRKQANAPWFRVLVALDKDGTLQTKYQRAVDHELLTGRASSIGIVMWSDEVNEQYRRTIAPMVLPIYEKIRAVTARYGGRTDSFNLKEYNPALGRPVIEVWPTPASWAKISELSGVEDIDGSHSNMGYKPKGGDIAIIKSWNRLYDSMISEMPRIEENLRRDSAARDARYESSPHSRIIELSVEAEKYLKQRTRQARLREIRREELGLPTVMPNGGQFGLPLSRPVFGQESGQLMHAHA